MQNKALSNKIPWDTLLGQETEVVVGCSGGADSVCLLLLLKEQAQRRGIRLRVLHVNHCLRGEESDSDEAFVKELCDRLGVRFSSVCVDVRRAVNEHGWSTEEAARNLRYEALRKEAAGALIAVAHNSDDQAETVLWNIIRGCDITGLAGMKQKDGDIIRPLLGISRAQIELYLREQGQAYRTDSTNNTNDYTRNKIRNELLPYIREHINSGVSEHLAALSESAAQCGEFLEAQSAREAGRWNAELESGQMPNGLAALPQAAAAMTAYKLITKAAGAKKDIERKHISAVLGLFDSEVGSRIQLPYGLVALREYEGVRVIAAAELEALQDEDAQRSETLMTRLNGRLASAKTFSYEGQEIPNQEFIKWLDYDTINPIFLWRTARPGDYIMLSGGIKKPLNRFMIDAKIPREERRHLPLLAAGDEIVWIPGYRIGESFKITEKTKKIIAIKYEV